jgi:uncharacterized membrane protein
VSSHPNRSLRPILTAALLGAATGLRSQMGLAMLVWRSDRQRLPGPLRSPTARRVVALAALGELAADKYPGTPPRTAPRGLVGRLGFGALSGGLGGGGTAAAAVGAALAVASAFGGMAARARLSRRFPPLAVAVAEDGLAAGLALVGCMTQLSE